MTAKRTKNRRALSERAIRGKRTKTLAEPAMDLLPDELDCGIPVEKVVGDATLRLLAAERRKQIELGRKLIELERETAGIFQRVDITFSKAELELLDAKRVRAGFSRLVDYLRFVAIHGDIESVNIRFWIPKPRDEG